MNDHDCFLSVLLLEDTRRTHCRAWLEDVQLIDIYSFIYPKLSAKTKLRDNLSPEGGLERNDEYDWERIKGFGHNIPQE